jgi:hypothetical protein
MTDIIETTAGVRCQMCGVVNWPTAIYCMSCTTTLDKRPESERIAYPLDAPMSFSQKVARFFEVIDYLLLPPATFGLVFSMLLLTMAPWVPLIITASYLAGCFLLRGFFKHSRGRLSDKDVSILWCATMAYNFVEAAVFGLLAGLDRAWEPLLFSIWPLLVVLLAALALFSESTRKQSLQ